MNKLRLVVTEACNRSCPGCCMNPPPVKPVPISFQGLEEHSAKEVYITGGEPLLESTEDLQRLCTEIDYRKIIIYSAYTGDIQRWKDIVLYIDGITFTIHEREDLSFFCQLNELILKMDPLGHLSLWLNVFEYSEEEVAGMKLLFSRWKVKKKEWLEECPVPEGEDFRKLIW